MRYNDEIKEDEIGTPLPGSSGKFEIVKLFQKEVISLDEFTDSIVEASKRINYLNNRAWAAVYMVRKKY